MFLGLKLLVKYMEEENKINITNNEDSASDNTEEEVSFVEEDDSPAKTIKKLREKLRVCETEKIEYLNGWQRAKADYINARKTEEKNISELEPFLIQKIMLEIIPIADNFDMAFSNKESLKFLDGNWRVGIEGIYSNLLKVISSFGVEQFGCEGDKFDPERYQAIGIEESDDKEKDDIVVSVVQKGYLYRGKAIRPCKVKVGVFKK